MLLDFFLLAVGAGALYFGAEWLVRGGARLGESFGLSPMVIGLTIVSLGTSAPELVVCLVAALRGNSDLAIGNVLGSNLANIGLILGVTAIIYPLKVAKRVVAREVPVMLAITLLAYPLLLDGQVSRLDASGLLLLLTTYMVYLLWDRKGLREIELAAYGRTVEAEPHGVSKVRISDGEEVVEERRTAPRRSAEHNRVRSFGLIAGGAVGLMLGGEVVVRSATDLAEVIGLSQLFIGLTIVAIGTSLPELATSVVAAIRKEADIAVGNIIGSNIFNLTAVLGFSALIHPIDVAAGIMSEEYLAVGAISLLLFPVAWTAYCIRRWEGAILVGVYGSALWWLVG